MHRKDVTFENRNITKTMRSIILCSILLMALVPLQAQNKAELTIQTEVFCDHCIGCESCRPRIEDALLLTKGVKDAKFDDETQTIKVVYNPKKTDPATLRTAVSKAGFKADDIPADPIGYSKLDGCCKRKN